jgi:FolB domain-containing protein
VLSRLLTRLTLADLRIMVRLGCEADERARPQPVDVTLEMEFLSPPEACRTDELDKTVCYDRISRALTSHCAAREFCLVERLGFELFEVAKEIVGPQATLTLHAKKVQPPVQNLRGGAVFSVSDKKAWSS